MKWWTGYHFLEGGCFCCSATHAECRWQISNSRFQICDPDKFSQVLLDNLAGWHPGSQSMQRLIQTHLCAPHKDELGQHAFRSEQILRFPQIVAQERGIAEIEELMLLRLWRIDLAIEIFRESDERPAGARQ